MEQGINPTHYKSNYKDSMDVQVTITTDFLKTELASMLKDNVEVDDYEFKRAVEKACCIFSSLKHFIRLGRKDDSTIEITKSMNYLHRALHGEWMK